MLFDERPANVQKYDNLDTPETVPEFDLIIEETAKGKYKAIFEGKTIVRDSSEPALASCRYLEGKGLDGLLKVYGTDGKRRLTCNIRKAARLTVKGSYFTPYNPLLE